MSRYIVTPYFQADVTKAEEPWAKSGYVERVLQHLSAKDTSWRDEQDAKLAQPPIASMRLKR